MKRLLSLLLIVVYFAMPHAAHAQTAYQTCAFSDPTHCYGIGPGNSGQAYVSNGPSSYPSFSSSLSGVTSVGGVTVPATASVFVTGATTTTAGECLLSTTTAGLGSWATCPGGGGGTPGGSNFELQYNNSGAFGGIALGTLGQPLLSDGSAGAPAFGTLNLTFTTGTLGCSELPTFTGDVTNTNCAMTVGQINGAVVPASAQILGSNSSRQLVAASIGSTTQLIYNQTGSLTGSTYLTWNQSSNVLNVGATSTPGTVSIGSLDSMVVNGVGIPVPGFALNSNIQGVIENHSYTTGTSAGAARLYLSRADGSYSAPSIVVNGDHLGTIYGIGYNGVTNNYLAGGYEQFIVDGTPSSTAMPSDWILALAGASGSPATFMRAYGTGGLVVGSATGGSQGAGTVNATGLYINGVAVGTGGTVTDGAGTTTANEVAVSTATAHTISYSATLPTAAMPALSGDLTGTAGSLSVTVSKVNGAAFPTSANCISSNGSAQPVAGCPQAINVEPLAPPVQSAATTSTTGGTLAAATYYYVIEATNASGNSSVSNEENVTTTGTTSSNTITWAAVTGATGYTVYRGTSAGGENVYYSPGNVTTYTDTNATSTSGSPPGAAYTIQSTDAGKLLLFSNATPVAVTLPQATGSFASGFAFNAQNKGAGLVTITPTTSTINGAATLKMPENMGCSGASDGANYQVASCTALLSNWLNAASSGTSVTPICQPGLQRTVTTVTATGNFTINAPTGCTEGQQVMLKITYTASDTYTWNAAYHANAANPGALPTATGGTSGVDMFVFYDDAANSRFDYLAEAPAF